MTDLKFQAIIELRVSSDDKIEKYNNLIFKSNIDYCRILEGVKSNYMVKVALEHFGDLTNAQKCPFPKGNYSYLNLKVTDQNIPIMKNFKFKFYIKNMGKVAGIKGFIHLYTQTYYGTIKKKLLN